MRSLLTSKRQPFSLSHTNSSKRLGQIERARSTEIVRQRFPCSFDSESAILPRLGAANQTDFYKRSARSRGYGQTCDTASGSGRSKLAVAGIPGMEDPNAIPSKSGAAWERNYRSE